MKKDIEEILRVITPNTPIEEVCSYCDTVEDIDLILASLPETEYNPKPISDELKQAALKLVEDGNLSESDITIAFIQRSLHVGFHLSAAIAEWLRLDIIIKRALIEYRDVLDKLAKG